MGVMKNILGKFITIVDESDLKDDYLSNNEIIQDKSSDLRAKSRNNVVEDAQHINLSNKIEGKSKLIDNKKAPLNNRQVVNNDSKQTSEVIEKEEKPISISVDDTLKNRRDFLKKVDAPYKNWLISPFTFNKKKVIDMSIEAENKDYYKLRRNKLIANVISIGLILFLLFSALNSFSSIKKIPNYSEDYERQFLNEFMAIYVKQDSGMLIDKVSIDKHNKMTFYQENNPVTKVEKIEVIKRDINYSNNIFTYIYRFNFSNNKSNSMILKTKLKMLNNRYIITENPTEYSYPKQKLINAEKRRIMVDENDKRQELKKTISDTQIINRLQSGIEVFFDSYNKDYERLAKTTSFNLRNYGEGNFDIKNLKVNSCNLNKNYQCIIEIDFINKQSNVKSLHKFKIIIDKKSNNIKNIK